MQFEKKTIAPNPSTHIYVQMLLKNKIQVIRYNITQLKYVYYLYKRFDINKKRQVASHYLDS